MSWKDYNDINRQARASRGVRLDCRDLHCCTTSGRSTMSYSMIFVATPLLLLLWLLLTPQFYAKFNHFQQFQPSISAGAGNVLGYSGGHCHWLARNMEIECAQLTSASAATTWSQFTTIIHDNLLILLRAG